MFLVRFKMLVLPIFIKLGSMEQSPYHQ